MDNNRSWFNQMLLYHKDNEFNSDGVIELSISNFTSDFKIFSAPNLIFSITNGTSRRSYTLNYQNANDLLDSLRSILNNPSANMFSSGTTEIFKKYHYDRSLKLEFKTFSNNPIVVVSIYYNESDFGRIIVSFDLFKVFAMLLKNYIEKYVDISFNISSRSLSIEILEELKGINFGIKTIPGSLSAATGAYIKNTEPDVPDSIMKKSEERISELDSFMDKEMPNIVLPEEKMVQPEVKKENSIDINSKFLSKVMNNDLVVLENLMTSAAVCQNPIKAINDNIKRECGIDLLEGISEKDMKSVLYISKLIYLTSLNCYSNFNVAIPSSLPVIKAKLPTTVNPETADVIFDLLMFSSYVRTVRSRLESKIADASENKAIFYMGLRCFTDVFVYSFLDTMDPNVIKSCVLNRFKSYKEKKIFSSYEELLRSYDCQQVTEKDLDTFMNILGSKVIGKTPYVDEFHSDLFNKKKVRLASDNNLNMEQIINTIIPVELFVRLGNKIEDYNVDLSEDIIEMFKPIEPEKEEPKKREPKKNNLFRFVKSYDNEIPETSKRAFLDYVEELSDTFDYTKFKLSEFGDNIVKAIYEWNEGSKTEKYTDFYDRCSNTLMSKDLVLSKIVNVKKEETSGDDWFGNLDVD